MHTADQLEDDDRRAHGGGRDDRLQDLQIGGGPDPGENERGDPEPAQRAIEPRRVPAGFEERARKGDSRRQREELEHRHRSCGPGRVIGPQVLKRVLVERRQRQSVRDLEQDVEQVAAVSRGQVQEQVVQGEPEEHAVADPVQEPVGGLALPERALRPHVRCEKDPVIGALPQPERLLSAGGQRDPKGDPGVRDAALGERQRHPGARPQPCAVVELHDLGGHAELDDEARRGGRVPDAKSHPVRRARVPGPFADRERHEWVTAGIAHVPEAQLAGGVLEHERMTGQLLLAVVEQHGSVAVVAVVAEGRGAGLHGEQHAESTQGEPPRRTYSSYRLCARHVSSCPAAGANRSYVGRGTYSRRGVATCGCEGGDRGCADAQPWSG